MAAKPKTLTQAEVDAAEPVDGRLTVLKDGKVPGLVLRVSSRGKLWAVWFRVKGTGEKGLWSLGRVSDDIGVAEARDLAREVLRDARAGRDPRRVLADRQAEERRAEAAAITVGEVLNRYVESRATEVADSTIKEYRRLLAVYLKHDPIAKRPAMELRRIDAREFLDGLATERGQSIGRSMHKVMRGAFRWAEDHELIPDDRLFGLKFAQPPARDRVLSDAELGAYWKALDAAPSLVAAVLRLQVLTGVRYPSELLAAQWRDVDLKARRWELPAATRKGNIPHVLPLSDAAHRLLTAVERNTAADGPRVFGPVVKRSQVETSFRRAEEAVRAEFKTDRFVPHDIRRSLASGIVRLGIAPWPIADAILGHRVKGTAAVYVHGLPLVDMAAALEKWGRHVEALVSGEPSQGADIVPMVRS